MFWIKYSSIKLLISYLSISFKPGETQASCLVLQKTVSLK
jgi:hypothetical protein